MKTADADYFTEAMRTELLQLTNPRLLKHLSSFLPLYLGMRLLLCSKDCVRFGLMNGCECILEHIVFADEETLPEEVVAGDPVMLQYMPVSLILRAVDAPWRLTDMVCPQMPRTFSRQGLFQLQPSQVYISRKVERDKYTSVRRTQFATLPADTRIVFERWS